MYRWFRSNHSQFKRNHSNNSSNNSNFSSSLRKEDKGSSKRQHPLHWRSCSRHSPQARPSFRRPTMDQNRPSRWLKDNVRIHSLSHVCSMQQSCCTAIAYLNFLNLGCVCTTKKLLYWSLSLCWQEYSLNMFDGLEVSHKYQVIRQTETSGYSFDRSILFNIFIPSKIEIVLL